jgi:hypothetical protein
MGRVATIVLSLWLAKLKINEVDLPNMMYSCRQYNVAHQFVGTLSKYHWYLLEWNSNLLNYDVPDQPHHDLLASFSKQ